MRREKKLSFAEKKITPRKKLSFAEKKNNAEKKTKFRREFHWSATICALRRFVQGYAIQIVAPETICALGRFVLQQPLLHLSEVR